MCGESSSVVRKDKADRLFTMPSNQRCEQPTPNSLVAYPSLSINIDKVFFPFSAANSNTRSGLQSPGRSYRPCWRDLKINESITIQQCHVKERKHRHGVVGEDSIFIHRIV
jgi:hypothetical protein